MNLEQIEKDIDNEVDVNQSYTELKRISEEVDRLKDRCKAIWQIEKDEQSLRRKKFYLENREMVRFRADIKEAVLKNHHYEDFICEKPDAFKISKDEFTKLKSIVSLSGKLEYIETLIK